MKKQEWQINLKKLKTISVYTEQKLIQRFTATLSDIDMKQIYCIIWI